MRAKNSAEFTCGQVKRISAGDLLQLSTDRDKQTDAFIREAGHFWERSSFGTVNRQFQRAFMEAHLSIAVGCKKFSVIVVPCQLRPPKLACFFGPTLEYE